MTKNKSKIELAKRINPPKLQPNILLSPIGPTKKSSFNQITRNIYEESCNTGPVDTYAEMKYRYENTGPVDTEGERKRRYDNPGPIDTYGEQRQHQPATVKNEDPPEQSSPRPR